MVSWSETMKAFPQPLKTWLIKSYLTTSSNNSCVLFVDQQHVDIINNTQYLSKIYPQVKTLYPDMLSLHITSSTIHEYAKDEILLFENFELE